MDLVPNEPAGAEVGARSRLVTSSMMSSEMYNEIKELYITAAQRAPEKDIDSNVQASTLLLCSVSVTTQTKEARSSCRALLKVVEICVRLKIFAKRLQHQTQKLNIFIHGLNDHGPKIFNFRYLKGKMKDNFPFQGQGARDHAVSANRQ